MTRPELLDRVQRRGLEAALDGVSLADVPEGLREAWHAARQSREEYLYWLSKLPTALARED